MLLPNWFRTKPLKTDNSKQPLKLWPSPHAPRAGVGSRLRWRIVVLLLLVSLLPMGLLAVGSWSLVSRLLLEQTLESQRNAVKAHASAVDLYLGERLRALELAAGIHELEELSNPESLAQLYHELDRNYRSAFVDLGVIDADGTHVAYVGPYHLADKKYAGAQWFETTMSQGTYLSDVFLGYRKVPHCIIAIKRNEGRRSWILRATINNDSLYSLVRAGAPGEGGDAFIVNQQGVYQTPPRVGEVLEHASIELPALHHGAPHSRVRVGAAEMVQASEWINHKRWLLVIQQPADRIIAPVDRAATLTEFVLLLVVVLVVATTLFATRHLTDQVDRANRERDALQIDLIRSAKLASLGELASGLAHEINNPLAVITAEQTNIADVLQEIAVAPQRAAELDASLQRCQRQVQRCATVTTKMLQFGRRGETKLVPTQLAPLLRDTKELLARQTRVRNVELRLEIEPDLPDIVIDPNELEQVLANLINNSMAAIQGSGTIWLRARARVGKVELTVEDTGPGIPPEDLDRVFQPFFTTKPPGSGTGLGLSVCYGIVTGWGGSIEADSESGQGSRFRIELPVASGARDPAEKM